MILLNKFNYISTKDSRSQQKITAHKNMGKMDIYVSNTYFVYGTQDISITNMRGENHGS